MKNHSPSRITRQRGFTIVESCVVLAVGAVSLSAVMPSFEQLRERHQLEGVSAQLETDIMFTRSMAVARNQTLRLRFVGPSCYVVHTGSTTGCECRADGSASCAGNVDVLRVSRLNDSAPVALHSNSTSLAFDAVKGTVTPTATIQVQANGGASLRSIVNIMGRVRNCSPAPALPGHAVC